MACGKAPNYHFEHPKLGAIVGLARGSDVVQFRGIPFASIPARFRQSILATSLPSQPYDARKPGPICPQRGHPFPVYWTSPPPVGYPCLPPPPEDEFDCLNLCITAPRNVLEHHPAEDVPVLVFIHGGALVGGSQSVQVAGREVYDATNFVASGISRGQPLLVVTINYRLGPLGFLASEELARESRRNCEAVGNYGLHDQRQALEWVHHFIGGFGGDAKRVTISGSYAGGAACHYLTTFPDRRFQSAIISSGTLLSIGPRPPSWHQGIFDCFKKKLATGSVDPVEALRTVPVPELLAAEFIYLYNPLIDNDWIRGGSVDVILGRPDAQPPPAIMIGATEYERDLAMLMLSDVSKPAPHAPKPDDEMIACARDMFSISAMVPAPVLQDFPFSVLAVAEAYGLDREQAPSNSFANWADLMADIALRTPPLYLAAAMKERRDRLGMDDAPPILVFEIRAANPFKDSPATNWLANHSANDVMLFDPAEDQVPPEQLQNWKGVVSQVQGAWLDFCYGETPWEPYDGVRGPEADGFGPVYVFQDGPRGRLCQYLAEIDGFQTAVRWRALLEAARDEDH